MKLNEKLMLYDYYSIIGIPFNATLEDIKKAFRRQAHIWHPDKNPGKDTVKKMQDINEAYLILSDAEARAKYDIEYMFVFEKENERGNYNFEQDIQYENNTHSYYYDIRDEKLKDWINKARTQAESLTHLSLDDIFGITKSATKGFLSGGLTGILYCIIIILIFVLFASLFSSVESGFNSIIFIQFIIICLLVCYCVYRIIKSLIKLGKKIC